MKRSDRNLLYAFDALSRTRSVKAAAEMLNLSAPAMSHTLARLRETTGDPLLVKAGRKLIPTPRALAMIEETRDVVVRAQAILAPAMDGERKLEERREFVVIAPDELSIAHGARLLSTIKSRMPNATLAMLPTAASDMTQIRQGAVDVEIGTGGKLAPEMKFEVLRKQRPVVALRRGHDLVGQKMTLSRYVKAEHVSQSSRDGLDELIERGLASVGATRRSVLRVATSYAALAAASRSDLIATTHDSLAQAVAGGLGLSCLPFPIQLEQLAVGQLWHPRAECDPQHVWLRACIRSVLIQADA